MLFDHLKHIVMHRRRSHALPYNRAGSRNSQITDWKAHVVEAASGLFGAAGAASDMAPAIDVKTLRAKIGELTLENDFLSGALTKAGLLSAKR